MWAVENTKHKTKERNNQRNDRRYHSWASGHSHWQVKVILPILAKLKKFDSIPNISEFWEWRKYPISSRGNYCIWPLTLHVSFKKLGLSCRNLSLACGWLDGDERNESHRFASLGLCHNLTALNWENKMMKSCVPICMRRQPSLPAQGGVQQEIEITVLISTRWRARPFVMANPVICSSCLLVCLVFHEKGLNFSNITPTTCSRSFHFSPKVTPVSFC